LAPVLEIAVQAQFRTALATIRRSIASPTAAFGGTATNIGRTFGDGKARDVRSITEFSYKRGEATFVEFLDAQRAYNDTMQTYNDARADFARALYEIDAAVGINATGEGRP